MDWMDTATRQHGVLTRSQVGPHRSSADWLVSRGLLRRISPSVFAVAGAVDSPGHRAWIAALAGRGVLAGPAAGYLWGMRRTWPEQVTVYVPRGRARCTVDGVVAVRRDLPVTHTTERDGLPVTNRTVTALDLMGRLPLTEGVPFADRALQQGWVTRDAAQRRLQRHHRGNPRLRQVMRLVGPGQAESEAERRAQQVLRDAGLTGWVATYPVWIEGRRFAIDIAFPHLLLAVEIDGFAYHASSDRFTADRTRQNLLVSAGWTVLRFSWQDLTDRPHTLVEAVSRFVRAAR